MADVIVITGAGRGLGGALAEAAVRQGAQVVAAARSRDDLAALAKAATLTTQVTDVTVATDVERLAHATVEKFGRIDVWINNAGIWTPRMPMEELPSERLRAMVEVNFFGTWYGCQAAVRQMKRQASGTIVNILSTSALQGRAGSAGYVASIRSGHRSDEESPAGSRRRGHPGHCRVSRRHEDRHLRPRTAAGLWYIYGASLCRR